MRNGYLNFGLRFIFFHCLKDGALMTKTELQIFWELIRDLKLPDSLTHICCYFKTEIIFKV